MAVNFKTLKSFVTAVDSMSLSAAANSLHIAQPALSQQIAALESHFKQRLSVAVGLATYSTTSTLSTALLKAVRRDKLVRELVESGRCVGIRASEASGQETRAT